jgi:hypothetical protein
MRPLRIVLCVAWMVLFNSQNAFAALIPDGAGCAPTAEAAVARILSKAAGSGSAAGFKVVAVRTDSLRKRSWAIVASCSDASWPMVAIELAADVATFSHTTAAQGQVRIGDRVVVQQDNQQSRIELAGVAEDSGALRDLIRVRLTSLSSNDAPPVIRCRVVGRDIVEMAQ